MPVPRHYLRTRHISPDVFDGLQEFRVSMCHAEDRCRQIAQGEKLLGYEDWRAYADMAEEIKQLYRWVYEELI